MITYFVYFSCSQKGHSGTGNICIDRDSEIDSAEDIEEIQKIIINESSAESVIINNFIKLKGEKHDL